MSHLEKLSDDELHQSAIAAARQDQASTLVTIDHLREVYRRMIHLKRGFSSLQNYAEDALGFSDSTAAERVSAMRLTMAVPEARAKMESRELTVSSAVAVERFIRREEHVSERRFTSDEKREMVEEIAGCSVRETRKALLGFAQDPEPHLLRERERPVTPTRTELRLFVNDHFTGEVERVRELKGNLSLEVIFTAALEVYLRQIDPVRRRPKAKKEAGDQKSESRTDQKKLLDNKGGNGDGSDRSIRTSEPAPPASELSPAPSETPPATSELPSRTTLAPPRTGTRYVLVSDERKLQDRSGGQCEFVYKKTGRRCPGRWRLQNEHRLAFALGGPTEFWNLRHYCRAHNRLAAVQTFGERKMDRYLRT